ncbi:hypothetical protein Bca101_026427 [Brassica carinata]
MWKTYSFMGILQSRRFINCSSPFGWLSVGLSSSGVSLEVQASRSTTPVLRTSISSSVSIRCGVDLEAELVTDATDRVFRVM